ncbi:MAG: toll/interleukin-1 receptor domain-containing protein [Promethearchaeota archaeon]
MLIFISHSGELSHDVALELKKFINNVFKNVKVFISSKIKKGSNWRNDIQNKLKDANFGIFCITKQNQVSPWIQFEAGAISKHFKSAKVCPVLIAMDDDDLVESNPIKTYQTTKINENDFKTLFITINDAFDEPLTSDQLDSSFKQHWLTFKEAFDGLLNAPDEPVDIVVPEPEYFHFKGIRTDWITVDGNGIRSYTPENVSMKVTHKDHPLPPPLKKLREQIEKENEDKKARGESGSWNGPKYAMNAYTVERTIPDEHMRIRISLRMSDYYNFLATVGSFDKVVDKGRTSRELFLSTVKAQNLLIPELAHGIGTCLLALTSDDYFLFTRRSTDVGPRKNEFDVSIIEGIQPQIDINDRGLPDVFKAITRGTWEELGVEISRDDVVLLGFGVDMHYYQWNFIGYVNLSKTKEEITKALELRPDKFESKIFYFVKADPSTVIKYLENKTIWASGLITIFWSLVNICGDKDTGKHFL